MSLVVFKKRDKNKLGVVAHRSAVLASSTQEDVKIEVKPGYIARLCLQKPRAKLIYFY